MKLSWISIIPILLVGCSSIGQQPAPHLAYVAPTKAESEVIAKGGRYHDNKKYDLAVKQYLSVLEKNPHNAAAMYVLGMTYYTQHDYKNSLRYASRSAMYDSPFLAQVYLLLGLSHEKLGQFPQAIQVYQPATARFAQDTELKYRLAISYRYIDRPEDAAEIFKKIIAQDPYHADSHFQLGLAYYQYDYKTPALLSLMTYLLIEPDSPHALTAAIMLDDIFKSGIISDEKTGAVTLAVNPDAHTDEGDFRLLDIELSARRAELLSSKAKLPEMQIKLEQLTSYLLALSQLDTIKNNQFFIFRHYQPFYKQVYKRKLTPALLNYTLQPLKDKQSKKWVANNRNQIEELKSMFLKFNWKGK